MKGAVLLSKSADFFRLFAEKAMDPPFETGVDTDHVPHTLRSREGKHYFLLSDRRADGDFFEMYEMPEEALEAGYRYAYRLSGGGAGVVFL